MPDMNKVLGAIGEISEYGSSRIVLPDLGPFSFYPMTLGVSQYDVSPFKDDGSGGSPYVQFQGLVNEGPYEGAETSARVFMTPGETGRNLGFIIHMAKVINGKVNTKAFDQFGFDFGTVSGDDQDEVNAVITLRWGKLTLDERKDFIAQLTGIAYWDGKGAIVKVTQEEYSFEGREGDTISGVRNQFKGFYPPNDPRKGIKWVRTMCFPQQETALRESMVQEVEESGP